MFDGNLLTDGTIGLDGFHDSQSFEPRGSVTPAREDERMGWVTVDGCQPYPRQGEGGMVRESVNLLRNEPLRRG